MKHTPTPWNADLGHKCSGIYGSLDNGNIDYGKPIYDCGYDDFTSLSEEDLKHIVKCVNMHDELLEALIKVHEYSDDPELMKIIDRAIEQAKDK